ncbi:uncharacterized protein LOC126848701 [Cataglyphis hispanica]|uniref:uncharacterized protein LOC126848701 n=1 Tax=Cataglyphis hispanica TaxID=1086592 RepID=UPI00217F63B9|nr:uncharacterized protein LOC126848701 [Cataglyphis hispanica]
MEREKNEWLTARKIEEEEMKRELTDIGIYEPQFTYKEMKRLLVFINESPDTSKAANNNDTHKEQHTNNQHLSEIAFDANALQETAVQECTEVSKYPSYSYRLNRTSPTVHEHKTASYINNPGSPSLFEVRNSMYRRKSSDSDEIFEKQFESTNSTHSTNHFLSSRSTNIPRESQNAADREMAQDTQGEFVQRLERWRLNPLDVCINENDVPLQQPNRSLTGERISLRYNNETHTSEQRDQAIRFMNQHLKEIADLWYSWLPADLIFQWGSPIQVGTANSSLDKKLLTESKTEQIKTECTYRDNHERACKRKANSIIASLNKESSTEDEEDKWDSTRGKKKRVQSGSKSSNVQRAANQHTHNDSHEKATSSVIARQGNSINDDNSDIDFDNEHIKSVCSEKTDEENENVTELNTYPRRIVPPSPKTRLSLSRHRKRTATSKSFPKTRQTNKNKIIEETKKQKNTLTNKEIYQKLIEDWSGDEEEPAVIKNVKIRPLPIPKMIQSRLHEKQVSLHNTDEKTKAKEDESDGERKKEKRPKLCQQRKKEEKSSRIKNGNSWEHQLMSDDEEKSYETTPELDVQNGNQSNNVITSTNNVSCPICNKVFPHSEIQDHAANCEQFEINNEEDDNDAVILECDICSKYKTSNGIEYEDHVQQCITKHDKRHSHGSQDFDIPASSFHTNKRIINEQKDSEIAYLGQFPSDNKTKINTNRKRKLYTKGNVL